MNNCWLLVYTVAVEQVFPQVFPPLVTPPLLPILKRIHLLMPVLYDFNVIAVIGL